MSKPLYTTFESVKVKLEGKVRFQADPMTAEEGELSDALLSQLVQDAETEVELDLRGRYAIPFQSVRTGVFSDLPDHSRRSVRRAVDMQAIMLILSTDFGRGGKVDGAAYYEAIEEQYGKTITKLLGHDTEAAGSEQKRYRRTPPLEDMKLAPGNTAADDGRRGTIINTDASTSDSATYAEDHINDPSQHFPWTFRP